MRLFKFSGLILIIWSMVLLNVASGAAPVITSFTPNPAPPFTKVIVLGTDLIGGQARFYTGDTEVKWSPFFTDEGNQSGWFQVPGNISPGTYTVKIMNSDRTIVSNGVLLTVTGSTPTPSPTITPTPTPTPTPTQTGTKTPTPKPTSSSSIACTDNSQITTALLPEILKMSPGETKNFPITIMNSGDTKWYDGNFYRLNNLSDINILTPLYGHLPNSINPNQDVNWNFKITAPKDPGTYPLKLQMVHVAGGQYVKSNNSKCPAPASDTPFGAVLESNITVIAPSPSASETILPVATPFLGRFSGFLSDNWLWILIGLILLIGIFIVARFLLKNRSSLPPPIPPVGSSSGETPPSPY